MSANQAIIERYLARAAELRSEAELVPDTRTRDLLLSAAEAYENMAVWQRWVASFDNPAVSRLAARDTAAAH